MRAGSNSGGFLFEGLGTSRLEGGQGWGSDDIGRAADWQRRRQRAKPTNEDVAIGGELPNVGAAGALLHHAARPAGQAVEGGKVGALQGGVCAGDMEEGSAGGGSAAAKGVVPCRLGVLAC